MVTILNAQHLIPIQVVLLIALLITGFHTGNVNAQLVPESQCTKPPCKCDDIETLERFYLQQKQNLDAWEEVLKEYFTSNAPLVLDKAIARNDFSARTLVEYERRWKKLLARELCVGRVARRAFERFSDRRIERLFRIVQDSRTTEAMLNAPDFSFDWHSRLILRALWRFGPRAALSFVWPG